MPENNGDGEIGNIYTAETLLDRITTNVDGDVKITLSVSPRELDLVNLMMKHKLMNLGILIVSFHINDELL